LVHEREQLQADFIAEAKAAEGVRDATLEKAVLLRAELLATQHAFEECKSAREGVDLAVRALDVSTRV